MDLGSAIVGIVILLAIATPFVLLNFNSNKKRRLIVRSLTDFAEKNNCRISQFESWNNAIIGIDDQANQLFFIRIGKDNLTNQHIDLHQVIKCQMQNSVRTINYREGHTKVIDIIKLGLSLKDKNQPPVFLECYNAQTDNLTLSGELQIAEKWCKIIEQKITGAPKSS